MDFQVGREFKDTEDTRDGRRIEHQTLWKALRNNHTAAEWLAAKLKLEAHQIHVTKTQQIEQGGKRKVLVEGVTSIDGDVLRLSIMVDGEKPFQIGS